MREILFKAKRIDNGEWCEGSCVNVSNKHFYIFTGKLDISNGYLDFEKYSVKSETICQFTGLHDKNGNKIWENDVVSEDFRNYKGVIRFGDFESIVLKNVGFNIEWMGGIYYRQDLMYWAEKCEVMGSIFDNLDLLKGGSE